MIAIAVLATAIAVNPGPQPPRSEWRHDVGHVVSMAIGTPASALIYREIGATETRSKWLAVGTMLAAMVLKEVYDYKSANNFSGRDLITGSAGVGIGLGLTELIYRRQPARN